ncbi:MAG: hypothetical protein M5U17_09050 [Ignavibacterium sp.]|nr:hypothetical protein [Ignavibacterium sp.]
MKQITNIIKFPISKLLMLLISVSLIFYPNCSSSRIEKVLEKPYEVKDVKSSEDLPYLKLHMQNGDLYVLENWVIDTNADTVNGKGKLFNLSRELIAENNYKVPMKDIVLTETNKINSSGSGILGALTIITGAFTIICIANPKSCFGSCPTFYTFNDDDYIVQAEGFSSSILPSLEEKDLDALYRIKPNKRNFSIQLRNEAYETHIIRSANLLALQKPDNGRVFSTQDGKFYQAINLREANSIVAPEGNISEKLCSFDGVERFSKADSINLAERETIEVDLDIRGSNNPGIVIAARQTLLTTFLFYQTLAYLGSTAGDWLANVERSGTQFKSLLENPRSVLGNIDVLMQNEKGEWEKAGEVGETGPIATDIKIVPLNKNIYRGSETSSSKIRLRMAKGLWRIDYLAIADIGNEVNPIVIPPTSSTPSSLDNSNIVELLTNPDSVLITYPGNEYFLNYILPEDYDNYELFMESQGYYLEWMRQEWLGEENPDKVFQMLFNPQQFYKDLAPQFKNIEAEMEEKFWSSKYVLP